MGAHLVIGVGRTQLPASTDRENISGQQAQLNKSTNNNNFQATTTTALPH